MDRNEAAAALAGVNRTEKKLAEHARWSFQRHAMFGLMEGLLVAGIAQPMPIAAGMIAVAMSLIAVCIADDRRRHGMFVSGWQPGATRTLTIMLMLFIVVMVAASVLVRDNDSAQPLGYLFGAITFVVCTAGSLLWERIYRRQLECGERQ